MSRKLFALLLVFALLASSLPVVAAEPAAPLADAPGTHGEDTPEQKPSADTSRTYASYALPDPEPAVPEKPATKAGATEGSCGENLQWSFLSDTGELVISGTGAMTDYSSNGTPWNSYKTKITKVTVQEGVSYLGKYAFAGFTKLTDVQLPGSLLEIGSFVFQSCTSLTAIPLPEGLESIGYAAFNLAGLRSVHLPSTLNYMFFMPFYGCLDLCEITVAAGNETYTVIDGILYGLKNNHLLLCPADRTEHLVIPDFVTYLPEGGLSHCLKLEGITIPDNMKWEPNAFTFCKGLLNIYTYDTNPNYNAVDGVLYSKDHTVLVLFPAGRSGSYTVPDHTVEIGYGAFCRMENEINITMPDSVEVIGGSAFSYSPGLRNLKLSANLREIGAHAFNGCTNMTDVVLPESLTLLGYGSFEDCSSITQITLPSKITSIASDMFKNCSALKTVELKGAVTAISSNAFYYCRALEAINFPETLESISSYAFYGCSKLQTVELPVEMKSLGTNAFGQCSSITKIEIPQGIETIAYGLLGGCYALKEVTLPHGLKSIGNSAFYSTAIEQIVIPETVTNFDDRPFLWCNKLRSIHFLGDAPALSGSGIASTTDDLVLYYTEGAEGWTSPEWNGIATALWSYDYSTTATCVLPGVEHIQCKHCDLELSRRVAAYGHDFGQWSLGQQPTQEQEGYWIRTCSVCGEPDRETIPTTIPVEQSEMVSNNKNAQSYSYYGKTVKSYLVENADGTLTRIEYSNSLVTIERYTKDFAFLDRRQIPMELPIFGGFYEGQTDYFFVFGQTNEQEADTCEVVRVVRYSKDWLRKGHTSLYGANTYIPFDAGSLRMTQYGDMLYVHTCHEMYKSSDGYHHQANMIFGVYLPEMSITDQYTQVMNVGYGYVSHSFNQFILTDGNKLLTLNHGDAYPRSAVIVQYQKPAGEKQFTGQCSNTSVLKFTGGTGNNATGASLGAFELSSTSYLTAGNSILQDGSMELYGQRNIFLGVTPRGDLATAETTLRWFTNYDTSANITISTPHLVKIHENQFLLMWTENDILRYVFVDGSGIQTSQVYESNMPLSDCKPIVYNGAVCWYVTQNSKPLFCSIPLNKPDSPVMSELKLTVTLDPKGGTLENNTATLIYGKPYGELPVPQRKSAYRFLGWYTSTYSSATQITADTMVTAFADHTLYAKWEKQAHSCEMEVTEVIPANCTTGEITVYTCIYCDYSYRRYGSQVSHTWDDGTITTEPTCVKGGVKTFTCVLCGATKTESVPATGHSYTDTVTAPTCLERGYTTHTCTCGYSYTDTYTPSLGHAWDEGIITTEPGCTSSGVRTFTCQRCPATRTEAVSSTGHTYGDWTTVTAPTCTKKGEERRDCTACDHFEIREIPLAEHDYTSVVTAPTCTQQGYTTHTCAGCGHSYADSYTEPTGHRYGDWVTVTPSTCTEKGEERRACSACDHFETREIPLAEHDYTSVVTDPTCTQQGYTTHICSVCGASYADSYTEPTGHSYGDWVTVTPSTCTEKGEERRDCTACDHFETREVALLSHSYVSVVTDPTCAEEGYTTHTCSVCGASYVDSYTPTNCPGAHFTDMPAPTHWSHASIDWAIKNGITAGTSATAFSPNADCTRGQVVTFLWRAAGCPEPTTTNNPFTDVDADDYFYKAVLWAVENNITAGATKTTFNPKGACNRAQVVTFMYRTAGSPEPTSKENPFEDVSADKYYHDAVLWAVEKGITSGISATKFAPNNTCTRVQIVAFLYRGFGQ